MERLLNNRESVVQALKQEGYDFVTVDLAGLKSGGFNAALTGETSVSVASGEKYSS